MNRQRPEPDIVQAFRDPEIAWLLDRIVRRLERGQALSGTVSKSGASEAERRAVDDLLGRRSRPGKSLSLDLAALDTQFEVESIVRQIRGPIINLRAEQEAEARAWDALGERWIGKTIAHPWAIVWLEKLFASGVLKRLANRDPDQADAWLSDAWMVLEPNSHDDVLLASLAARITGDSHALDRGRPLASLCLRGIAERECIVGSDSAESRREAWAAIGVTIDDLSAPVLCLNLRPAADSELAPWLDWHVARGEPFFLPWRQVKKFEPSPEMERVFVCENPAIVSEAAHRLGPSSRPLLCMNGLPSATVKTIVRCLLERGIPVSLRADFDWAGLNFINQMRACGRIDLWRMTPDDYNSCSPSQSLKGNAFVPNWGEPLALRMKETKLAAYEEDLVDHLIADLAPLRCDHRTEPSSAPPPSS